MENTVLTVAPAQTHSNRGNSSECYRDCIDLQIKWYSTAAKANRIAYFSLGAALVTTSCATPVLIALGHTTGATVVGAIVAMLSGLIPLFSSRELWLHYRHVRELLRHELRTFDCRVGDYGTLAADPMQL